jgi:clorobiocin biosynthesis protein CloN4
MNKNFDSLFDLISASAEKYPEDTYIHDDAGSITYLDFLKLTSRYVNFLSEKNIGKSDRVILWTEKSRDQISLFYALNYLEAVFVPLDPEYPVDNVIEIAKVSEAKLVLCKNGFQCNFDHSGISSICLDEVELKSGAGDLDKRKEKVRYSDLAYILYTSGSTGNPKGACLTNENALSFTTWAAELIHLKRKDVIANHAPLSFGISIFDIFSPPIKGASVKLIPKKYNLFPSKLLELIIKFNVSIWYSVPSALNLLIEKGGMLEKDLPFLRVIMLAGEPLKKSLLISLFAKENRPLVYNFYGNTETNVCLFHLVCSEDILSDQDIPIGKVAAGDKVWVNENGLLQVSGPTVMLGYWGDEFNKKLIYNTQDNVCQDKSGNYFFNARLGNIVKIHGNRVSLLEIEKVIESHECVEQAIVHYDPVDQSSSRLVAFVKLRNSNQTFTIAELRVHCAKKLPNYKIINKLIILEDFPLNANGKVCRKSLALKAA